jgi:hypothetical protein
LPYNASSHRRPSEQNVAVTGGQKQLFLAPLQAVILMREVEAPLP